MQPPGVVLCSARASLGAMQPAVIGDAHPFVTDAAGAVSGKPWVRDDADDKEIRRRRRTKTGGTRLFFPSIPSFFFHSALMYVIGFHGDQSPRRLRTIDFVLGLKIMSFNVLLFSSDYFLIALDSIKTRLMNFVPRVHVRELVTSYQILFIPFEFLNLTLKC